jgi:hypothetical protein
MIKRSTWIWLILLVGLLIGYFIWDNRPSETAADVTPTAQTLEYLVTDADGTLQGLQIADQNDRLFEMQRGSDGVWMVLLPMRELADQGMAEAAATQAGALRIITSLQEQLSLTDYGLNPPDYSIELSFSNGVKHSIQVGAMTPINTGYYVRFDNDQVYVVGSSGLDALLNLVTSPPVPATATPEPTQEVTATPTLEMPTVTP